MIVYDLTFENPFVIRVGEEQDYVFCYSKWVFLSFKPLQVICYQYGDALFYEYPLEEIENFSEVQIVHVSDYRFSLIYKSEIPYFVVLTNWGDFGIAKLNFLQGKEYKFARKFYDFYLYFEEGGSIKKLDLKDLMFRVIS